MMGMSEGGQQSYSREKQGLPKDFWL